MIDLQHRAQVPLPRKLNRQRENDPNLNGVIAEIILIGRELDEWHHAKGSTTAIVSPQVDLAAQKKITKSRGAHSGVGNAIVRLLHIVDRSDDLKVDVIEQADFEIDGRDRQRLY